VETKSHSLRRTLCTMERN